MPATDLAGLWGLDRLKRVIHRIPRMRTLSNRLVKVGKSEVLQAAAILALVIIVAFWDVVFWGHTLLASNNVAGTMPWGAYGYRGERVPCCPVLDAGASAWDYETYVKLLHDYLAAGSLALWNPYVGCGAPFLAHMASGVLSPFRLLMASVAKPAFWDLCLLLRLFLAAFLTFLFARSMGMGLIGSLVSGIAFSLSGHFVLYVNMADLDVQILLPGLLLAVNRFVSKLSYPIFIATAFLVGLVILGGMPESAFYLLFFASLYFLVRAWTLSPADQPRWPRFYRQLICFAAAGVLGLLISLPLVLPFFEYMRHAFHPRGVGTGLVHIRLKTAISLILPKFFGRPHQTWIGIHSHGILPYAGATCWFLALAALCRKRPIAVLSVFFAGFSLFYFLKAYGIPPAQWVGYMPLFNMSLFPKHAFPEFGLCLAILAGIGAEGLLKNNVNYFRFAIASLLISLVVAGFAAHYWKAAVQARALPSIIRSCLIFGVAMALVWILGWAARRLGPSKWVALGLVLLPTLELASFVPHKRTHRYNAFTQPPFVDFLKTDREPYRVYSAENILYPNTNAGYRMYDIRTLDPIQVERYTSFLRKLISPKIFDRFDGSEPEQNVLRSPLLDLMNVKYILAISDVGIMNFTNDLLRDGFVLPRSRWGIGKNLFVIDGVPKPVLAQHPPSRIDYEVELPDRPTYLKFALALAPEVWSPEKGDGVTFRVDVTELTKAARLFSEYIDPKNRVSDRKWNVRSVDLSRYRGQEIYLIFQTLTGPDRNFDWAHWAQLPGGIRESLRAQLGESQIIAPAPNYVGPGELTIEGRRLETWLQHPPATVRFRLRVPTDQPTLRFAMGLDPSVWAPEKGDGVRFEILVAPVQTLFVRAIDPKNNLRDRKWHPASIDLSSFGGQRVLLSFHTLPEANNAFDWAGWGDLQLEGEREKFDLVYDREVRIYRNNQALPRAFIVHHAEVIPDKDRILARLTEPDFDPRKSVVVEENVPNHPALVAGGGSGSASPVAFERYEPNYIRLQTSLAEAGWLVLTDTYYPGWKVRVDGRPGRILAANYIFRAVSLEPGSHVVEFIYRPASFLLGVAISTLTMAVLLVMTFLRRSNPGSSAEYPAPPGG